MSFVSPEIKEIVESFWRDLVGKVSFPHDIESSALAILPVTVEKIFRLNLQLVYSWLVQRKISIPRNVRGEPREIFGCLVAYKGSGIIFVDSSASDAEQRFTIAHELAHFLRDYSKPRQLAQAKLGTNILEVFDGHRLPTAVERIDAILSDSVIGSYSDLLLRGPNNQFLSLHTSEVEKTADYLALELLAPYKKVLEFADLRVGVLDRETARPILEDVLQEYFGLPPFVVSSYAARLTTFVGKKPSIHDWLGL